jgi:hypothetical protein
MLDAAADPVDVAGLDAEIVLEDRARPDDRGQLILRHTDLAAPEVLRLVDAVGPHVDRGVAEHTGDKSRHANIGTLSGCGLDREARQRTFTDIELLAAKGTEKNFLRRQGHEDGINAVDGHGTVDQRPVAIVVADGN